MEYVQVNKDFVIAAHKAACGDWKQKIEDQFPEIFPKGIIGKAVYPRDNSYCINALTGKCATGVYLAGDCSSPPKKVVIISEPYNQLIGGQEKEFVTVMYQGEPYRILNRYQESLMPKPQTNFPGSSCTASPRYI